MTSATFWDKVAPKYARKPVSDSAAYDATLDRTKSYLLASDRILEIGCGTGSTALRLAPAVAHMTATDISSQMIEIAENKLTPDAPSNIRFLQFEALKPLADAPFDAVCAFNILHLLDDLPSAVAHLKSQVKPGGYVISKTGCVGEMNRAIPVAIRIMRAFGKAPFVNIFTIDTLETTFRNAGFELIETGHFGKSKTVHFIVARRSA